ncbi:MAG: hypothetical protein GY774_36545 [Planctomycetes bacterium]|nr:hypothetical protein [Planctomycetota bacterium]
MFDLKFGIRIPSSMPAPTSYSFYNHPSALENSAAVEDWLNNGLEMGIIAGPYSYPPHGLIVSPIAAIPKKDSNKYRIIHNLSFPYKNSVNSHIPRDFAKVSYETIDDCVKIIIGLKQGALMAKSDLQNAYFSLTIHVSDFHFLGFTWKDAFYFGKFLPMGLATSCAKFEKFSVAIQWILTNKLFVPFMSHILDDFLFFGPANSPICSKSLSTFLLFAESVGLPISVKKTIKPTTSVELHGLLVDTVSFTLAIPKDKVQRAIILIDQFLSAKKVTLRDLQSLAGLLAFFTRALPGARVFIRRLYFSMRGVHIPTHHIRLTSSIKQDLRMWRMFLMEFNGSHKLSHVFYSESPDDNVYTDASGKGFGGLFGSCWFQGSFPAHWHDYSIAIKEMVPVFIALQLWAFHFSSSRLCFHVDNISVVAILNSRTSTDPVILHMLRRMVLISMFKNIVISSKHISGKYNVVTDCISRFQISKARQWAPWLQPEQTNVPPRYLPWSEQQPI